MSATAVIVFVMDPTRPIVSAVALTPALLSAHPQPEAQATLSPTNTAVDTQPSSSRASNETTRLS
jgi:hypothetical protein